MLKKFREKGHELGFFVTMPMKDLKHSCTKDAHTPVIDFDTTKEFLYESLNNGPFRLNLSKSCDGLKIIDSLNQLDFIEIKGISNFRKYQLAKLKTQEEKVCAIDSQIESFELQEKIDQSIDILKLILQVTLMGFTNEEKKYLLENTKKDYMIVIDEEIEQDFDKVLAISMDYLSEYSDVEDQLIIKIKENVENISHIMISKPFLIEQSEVDAYYKNLLHS